MEFLGGAMNRKGSSSLAGLGGLVLASVLAAVASAQAQGSRHQKRELPESSAALRLGAPLEQTGLGLGTLHESLIGAEGRQQVIVRLRTGPVGEIDRLPLAAVNYDRPGAHMARRLEILDEQQNFLDRCLRAVPGAEVIARVQLVLNAVFLDVDAAALPELAKDPAVFRIAPVANYDLFLSETVPYVGAQAVQNRGFDGKGVKVAVLDSGVDYTHAAFGGSGNPADYAANDPDLIEPGTFPTAKVVDGFDFVGSAWPVGALAPDPDPLDDGLQAGHGTHVAHIIGGKGGVAAGVDLYAVKVCSSVSTSCSGIALINGMEFAADPNGDGDTRDRVDIINMSLGSDYGQPFDDDLSQAVENATALGVLTVAAAGNGSDRPYVQGTPAAAPSAISVAQTQVPSAFQHQMEVLQPASIAGRYFAVFQPWSAPLTGVIQAPVQYGAGGNLNGCAPFPAGSLAGKIVLVDRGFCTFTMKIFNIGNAGGLVGIIGLIAPGAPFAGAFADPGGPITIPGFMISQADSSAVKSGLPNVVARFGPDIGFSLAMSVVGTSSRGPQMDDNRIKPEIGAPGGSVSAQVGTGTGQTPFGGTSGASPMVAGAAALLLQARSDDFGEDCDDRDHDRDRHHRDDDDDDDDDNDRDNDCDDDDDRLSPVEIKALLMNNAETKILNSVPGGLAPITRIGGGELRVDRALRAPAAAWDKDKPAGALSFGFVDVANRKVSITKRVRVRNHSDHDIRYRIRSSFRFADDEAMGAVSITAPRRIEVEEEEDRVFRVTLTIDGARLRNNLMNSGSEGANPAQLTTNEYDGYLVLDDGKHPIRLPWHVLPRKAARVVPERKVLDFSGGPGDTIRLHNTGVGTAQNDAYSLLAVSPDIPKGGPGDQAPRPDLRAVGVNTFIVPPGFCTSQFVWAFAVNTWERQTHLIPVSHQVWLDANQDGTPDFVVLNRDVSFNNVTDGRQLSWVFNLSTNTATAFFFAEHATNTNNTALYICGEQVGLSVADILSRRVNAFVVAQDFYYGGPGDLIGGLTITPLGERYFGIPPDVPGKSSGAMHVVDFGAFPGNADELGVLLFTNGDRGAASRGGATKKTEALLFTVPD